MKIIGEKFEDYLDSQIKIRQSKIGNFSRDSDTLTYLSNTKAWIRITSGVNISETKCAELNIDPTTNSGNQLAKKYVLYNGVTDTTNNSYPKGGIVNSYENSLSSGKVYGFNSTQDYGFSPTPGVESLTVIPKNRGSLRESSFNIKCFNKEQFAILETLFLRLKYSVLVEWGHTVYFDNDGVLVTNPTNNVYQRYLNTLPITDPSADPYFIGPRLPDAPNLDDNQNNIQKSIRSQIKKSAGNYDAFVGFVTNFSWDLSPKGVYNIEVKLVSIGDIAESLSITSPVSTNASSKGSNDEDAGANSPLGKLLKSFKGILQGHFRKFPSVDIGPPSPGKLKVGKISPPGLANNHSFSFLNGSDIPNSILKDIMGLQTKYYDNPQNGKERRAIMRLSTSGFFGGDGNENFYYIKLGTLLRILEAFFLKYDDSKPSNPPSFFYLDHNFDNNFCNILPDLFSSDPRICLIPSLIDIKKTFQVTTTVSGGSGPITETSQETKTATLEYNNQAIGFDFVTPYMSEKNKVGKTMDIHVNIDYILEILTKNVNDDGDLSIYDFMTSILKGINKSLSFIPNLTFAFDQERKTYYIQDTNPLNDLQKLYPEANLEPTKILVGNLKEGEGSFAKNVSVSSQITPKLATQIAIGAQASGADIGNETVAFSRWNEGLTDRLVPRKITPPENPNSENASTPQNNFDDDIKQVILFLNKFEGGKLNSEDISEFQNPIKNYFKVEEEIETFKPNQTNSVSKVFIPISLSIDILGLGGVKIFSKYTINDEILPKNYKNAIDFIIKGAEHRIDSSGWTTTLESLSIPRQR